MTTATGNTGSMGGLFKPGQALSRHWGWVMADGVLGVIVGLLALALPGITVLALAFLLGFGLIVQGFFEVSAGLGAMSGSSGRGWTIFLGVVSLIAGLICVFQPGAGLFAIFLGVTIWFLAAGINELMAGFTLSEHRITNIVLGVVSIILAIILISEPGLALNTAAVLAGILFIVRGAGEIGLAERLRRAH